MEGTNLQYSMRWITSTHQFVVCQKTQAVGNTITKIAAFDLGALGAFKLAIWNKVYKYIIEYNQTSIVNQPLNK